MDYPFNIIVILSKYNNYYYFFNVQNEMQWKLLQWTDVLITTCEKNQQLTSVVSVLLPSVSGRKPLAVKGEVSMAGERRVPLLPCV